jgi:hypothetical protein
VHKIGESFSSGCFSFPDLEAESRIRVLDRMLPRWALRVKCKNEAYNSLRQVSILQIDEIERSCQELVEAARALEKGFEAQCRFLHTTQWLVSSQYFND